jgi:hypothetical protein
LLVIVSYYSVSGAAGVSGAGGAMAVAAAAGANGWAVGCGPELCSLAAFRAFATAFFVSSATEGAVVGLAA